MKTLNKWIIGSMYCLSILLISCSNHDTGTMTVKMAGHPQQHQAVTGELRSSLAIDAIYLDVRRCEMQYHGGTYAESWVLLATNAGIYNLYDLGDDATVVLVNEVDMPSGDVGQMRLVLGPANTIVIDGTTYPLKVPSAEESGLKINLNGSIHFDHYITVVLDFDPDHQIVELGNGGYILKPVMNVEVINQD